MKQCIRALVCMIAVISFLSAGVASAKDLNIVCVDTNKILNESLRGKDAVKQLEDLKKERQAEYEKRSAALQKINDEIAAEPADITPEAKDAKNAEYQKNLNELNSFTKDTEKAFKEKHSALLDSAKQDLATIITDYGKKNNIDLILYKNPSVVYASEQSDITDKILKIYDEQDQKKTKKDPDK